MAGTRRPRRTPSGRRPPRKTPPGWQRLANRRYRNKRSGDEISYREYRERFVLHTKPTRRPPSTPTAPWRATGNRQNRRYVNTETGETISRRAYDALYGRNKQEALRGKWHRVCAGTLHALLMLAAIIAKTKPDATGFIVVEGDHPILIYADEVAHDTVWRTISHGTSDVATLVRQEGQLKLRQEELVRHPRSWCLIWQ